MLDAGCFGTRDISFQKWRDDGGVMCYALVHDLFLNRYFTSLIDSEVGLMLSFKNNHHHKKRHWSVPFGV